MIGPAQSVERTTDGAVKATSGLLVSVVLTAGSDAATVILYDDPDSTDGNKVVTLKVAANTSVVFAPATPVAFGRGLYADLSGTDPVIYVAII